MREQNSYKKSQVTPRGEKEPWDGDSQRGDRIHLKKSRITLKTTWVKKESYKKEPWDLKHNDLKKGFYTKSCGMETLNGEMGFYKKSRWIQILNTT
ncbi:hypothetical protein TNCT_699081 [Trichonephila clavata]|uniref:Uncharacterized protein n=1 Tax=Trichonephila clavata TaxID=2740835 RepID=A0A8X6HWH0_TRICU|nr:hypothetical protein TNCT_699081 [Trichonephila clavata]